MMYLFGLDAFYILHLSMNILHSNMDQSELSCRRISLSMRCSVSHVMIFLYYFPSEYFDPTSDLNFHIVQFVVECRIDLRRGSRVSTHCCYTNTMPCCKLSCFIPQTLVNDIQTMEGVSQHRIPYLEAAQALCNGYLWVF